MRLRGRADRIAKAAATSAERGLARLAVLARRPVDRYVRLDPARLQAFDKGLRVGLLVGAGVAGRGRCGSLDAAAALAFGRSQSPRSPRPLPRARCGSPSPERWRFCRIETARPASGTLSPVSSALFHGSSQDPIPRSKIPNFSQGNPSRAQQIPNPAHRNPWISFADRLQRPTTAFFLGPLSGLKGEPPRA